MKIKAEDYFRNEENIYEKMTGKKSGFVLEKVDGVYELSKNRVVFVQTKTASEVRNFLDGFIVATAEMCGYDPLSVVNSLYDPYYFHPERVKMTA